MKNKILRHCGIQRQVDVILARNYPGGIEELSYWLTKYIIKYSDGFAARKIKKVNHER